MRKSFLAWNSQHEFLLFSTWVGTSKGAQPQRGCQEEHQLVHSLHRPAFIWLLSDVKDTEQKMSEGLVSRALVGERGGESRESKFKGKAFISTTSWQLISFPSYSCGSPRVCLSRPPKHLLAMNKEGA